MSAQSTLGRSADDTSIPADKLGRTKSSSVSSTCSDFVETNADAPAGDLPTPPPSGNSKKKKKKKPKKSAKAKAATSEGGNEGVNGRPPVLCISRNKHWKYISSYHGPWLQLPLELLQSLMLLNLDPTAISDSPSPPPPSAYPKGQYRLKDRISPPESPSSNTPPFPTPKPGQAAPPPIDPGVFRSVTAIRQLIDEAAELAVRASCGLSAAALGNMRNNGLSSLSGSTWQAAQTLGINPLGDFGSGNGRTVTMSATRVHRLRVLAVEKLAAAYKADEIASSVMVMQGGSVFDDLAERVLKIEPHNADARYVHFFHEKIPSRQLAESTTTTILDSLIAANPQRLEYYRTRGIVHCFRDEYAFAVMDFTHALKESRALRKARSVHSSFRAPAETRSKGKRKKSKVNGQAPPNGTSAVVDTTEAERRTSITPHPSTLPDAPDPVEPQLLFHRGAAYLAHAIFVIEEAIYRLEGVQKVATNDIAEMRLCHIENGKYGGTEINNPDGPLGRSDGVKARAYREVLAEPEFREMVFGLIRKSKRDHERFLMHFDTLGAPEIEPFVLHGRAGLMQAVEKISNAFYMMGMLRSRSQSSNGSSNMKANGTSSGPGYSSDRPPSPPPPIASLPHPLPLTTYHPLLVESHFSILIAQLLLGEYIELLPTFVHTAHLVVGLEGYPVFLPPRSMAQAEWAEVLERLAGGWKFGKMPDVREEGQVMVKLETTDYVDWATSSSSASSSSVMERTQERFSRMFLEGSPSTLVQPLSPISDDLTFAGSSAGPSTSASASAAASSSSTNPIGRTPSHSGRGSPTSDEQEHDEPMPAHPAKSELENALTSLRVLLAPVVTKQKEKTSSTVGAGTIVIVNGKGKATTTKAAVPAKEKEKEREREDVNNAFINFSSRPKSSINIPLHGPRVEIILAWLAAVHLPELEEIETV